MELCLIQIQPMGINQGYSDFGDLSVLVGVDGNGYSIDYLFTIGLVSLLGYCSVCLGYYYLVYLVVSFYYPSSSSSPFS